MAQVIVRLFGLGKGDASRATLTRTVEPGTTVQTLWHSLQREAMPGDKLATMESASLLVLVNGRPIQFLREWETVLADHDTVSYMPKAFGG
jgi:molybdopterin converting factor small subunit